MFKAANNGRPQEFPDSFKETHIRHRLGKDVWINDDAKKCHEELVRITSEQSQPEVTNPMSEQQVSVKVLGKRSGYLKGYGIRKNAKSNAMSSQPIPNPDVVALQQKVADQDKTIKKIVADQDETIGKIMANHEKAMADQAQMFGNMMMMVAMKSGIDLSCIPGLVPGSGNEEDTLVGEEDDEADD